MMVEFKNVSFKYGEEDDCTIKDINLDIDEGKIICLLGKSGSGKTTITRIINKLIPDLFQGELKGEIFINKHNGNDIFIGDTIGMVGSVFQDPRTQFFTTDVLSEVAFSCENVALPKEVIVKRMSKAIELLEIGDIMQEDVFSLSSGQKQLVAIASVYMLLPKIIVFDEPSSNLDYKAINKFKKALTRLKKENITIIIAEHRFHYLKEISDEVYIMNEGKIINNLDMNSLHKMNNNMLNNIGLRSCHLSKVEYNQINNVSNSNDVMLEVKDLRFSYDNKCIFNKCNFKILKGEIVALVGGNGVGKSTLLELICGLKKQDDGEIWLNNRKLNKRVRVKSSYFVSQDSEYQLFTESVEKELYLGIQDNEENKKAVEDTLRELELYDFKDKHPAVLSGGQKQRLTIGISVMQGKEITCLDEPTSGLDYENMINVANLLKKEIEDRVILVSTHDYEFILAACTSIIFIKGANEFEKIDININNREKILNVMNIRKEEDYL